MVNSVELSADVYLVCLAHALSTEKEEVMGLLLGEVREEGNGDGIDPSTLADERQWSCGSHLLLVCHETFRQAARQSRDIS